MARMAIRSASKVSPKIIAAATKLKVIGRAGIGVDNVDIPSATARGIIVMNTPFGNSITTAEHAISMMMALARQIPEANASTHAGKWEKNRFMGVELFNKTLGVIGCGNIGAIVADRALGLRMKVIAYDPFLSPERAIDIGVEKVELEDILRRSDFITLHTPLTDKTRGIIDGAAIGKMKKGVRIINCARGGLVVEEALHDENDAERHEDHEEAEDGDGAELTFFLQVEDHHRHDLGVRREEDDGRRQLADHADEDEAPRGDDAAPGQRRGDLAEHAQAPGAEDAAGVLELGRDGPERRVRLRVAHGHLLGHVGDEQDPQRAVQDEGRPRVGDEQRDGQHDARDRDRHQRQEGHELVAGHHAPPRDIRQDGGQQGRGQ